jgi:hypothetical protein
MTDFYIDVVNGASGNSGADSAHPKQYISQATLATGNRIFLKRGQVHPIATYRFIASYMTLDAYGTGAKPVLQKTAGGDAWIYLQDVVGVTLQNFDVDGNGFTGPLVAIHPASTGSSGHKIINLDLYGSSNHAGLYMEGTVAAPIVDVRVSACVFHGNASHGSMCYGEVRGTVFTGCEAYGNGFAVPAHGFSTYSDTASPRPIGVVFHNCYAHDNVDFNGQEGQGFQFDNNSVNCSFIGCRSINNEGAGFCFNVGSGHRVIGCIASGNGKSGLIATSNTGILAANNTFDGNCRSSAYTAEIVLQSTSTGATLNNNILTGSDTLNPTGISVDAGSASGTTAATNCIHGFTTAASGITPSGTITSDPLLANSFQLSEGSPCIGAGTTTVHIGDNNGKTFRSPPCIGAVETQPARTTGVRTVRRRTVAG